MVDEAGQTVEVISTAEYRQRAGGMRRFFLHRTLTDLPIFIAFYTGACSGENVPCSQLVFSAAFRRMWVNGKPVPWVAGKFGMVGWQVVIVITP